MIAVVTSGGDAPGMNSAVRAVARAAHARGWRAMGVRRGFAGLIEGDVRRLGPRDVGGIMQLGGTILGSARSEEFERPEGRARAVAALERLGVAGLVVVGGSGSQQGTAALARDGVPVVGVASTIDNDLFGAEPSLGFDTALNVALEAIDRLKTTASAFRRVFLLEVMGRDCGHLALAAATAGGAEAVVLPEIETDPERLAAELHAAYERGKPHAIVVVAEGSRWNAERLGRHFREHDDLGFDVRTTVLGHVQRGGRPGYFDRIWGARLGYAAVERLAAGETGILLGAAGGAVRASPLGEVAGRRKPLDAGLLALFPALAV